MDAESGSPEGKTRGRNWRESVRDNGHFLFAGVYQHSQILFYEGARLTRQILQAVAVCTIITLIHKW